MRIIHKEMLPNQKALNDNPAVEEKPVDIRFNHPMLRWESSSNTLENNTKELALIKMAAAICEEMELDDWDTEDAPIPITGIVMRRICKFIINNTRAACPKRRHICLRLDPAARTDRFAIQHACGPFSNATLNIITIGGNCIGLEIGDIASESLAARNSLFPKFKFVMPDDIYKRFIAALSRRKTLIRAQMKRGGK